MKQHTAFTVVRWFSSGLCLNMLLLSAGCSGTIFGWSGPSEPGCVGCEPGGLPPIVGTDPPLVSGVVPAEGPVVRSGMRRLTQLEYDNTLRDLLGETTATGAALLPGDTRAPFDNDYRSQTPSQALIEAADLASADVATRLLTSTARLNQVVGCSPSGPADEPCMRGFVQRFGLKAFRRPLATEELDRYTAAGQAIAVDEQDFYAGVDVLVRAFLASPKFLYRLEIGSAVAGATDIVVLDDWERASRLSYLLWGSMPDDSLFAKAAAGTLGSPAELQAAAREMLTHPKALEQIERFHAYWLGYERMARDELRNAMREETGALLERVIVTQKAPWLELFTAEGTFVTSALATHYGLPATGSAALSWVSYAASGRRGLLSQGSFLSLGEKFGDTSPVVRGKEVRQRLLCQPILPPPIGVDVDDPPPSTGGSPCKKAVYSMHSTGGCAGCHSQMDPIGFGLENYDAQGRFRSVEAAHPECSIDGEGELVGIGKFKGPAQLGALVSDNGISQCLSQQLYRFATGRAQFDKHADATWEAVISEWTKKGDYRFDDLLVRYVGSQAFGFRQNEL